MSFLLPSLSYKYVDYHNIRLYALCRCANKCQYLIRFSRCAFFGSTSTTSRLRVELSNSIFHLSRRANAFANFDRPGGLCIVTLFALKRAPINRWTKGDASARARIGWKKFIVSMLTLNICQKISMRRRNAKLFPIFWCCSRWAPFYSHSTYQSIHSAPLN